MTYKNTQAAHTVALTIGRNIGPDPMPSQQWQAFQGALTGCLVTVYGTASGEGEWDGIKEETFYVVGVVADATGLRAKLAILAAAYQQDAIGCITMSGTDSTVMAVAQ